MTSNEEMDGNEDEIDSTDEGESEDSQTTIKETETFMDQL